MAAMERQEETVYIDDDGDQFKPNPAGMGYVMYLSKFRGWGSLEYTQDEMDINCTKIK